MTTLFETIQFEKTRDQIKALVWSSLVVRDVGTERNAFWHRSEYRKNFQDRKFDLLDVVMNSARGVIWTQMELDFGPGWQAGWQKRIH